LKVISGICPAKSLLPLFFMVAFLFSCSDNIEKKPLDNDNIPDKEDHDTDLPEEDTEDDSDDEDVDDHEITDMENDEDEPSDGDEDQDEDQDEDPDIDHDLCFPNPCEEIPLSNGMCNVSKGRYVCGCEDGYEWEEDACTDINECLDDFLNNCHQYAVCSNTTGGYLCECIENYSGDGFSCAPDSREVDCTNEKPENSVWKTGHADGKITQTWNGEEFQPADDSCQWQCVSGYHISGDVCFSNTLQNQSCAGLPDNASWNIADKITQTWNGSTWIPSTTGAHNTIPSLNECRFKCNSYHRWVEPECSFCNLDNRCGAACTLCYGKNSKCRDKGDGTTECVECYSDDHCESPLSLCDPSKNICVECVTGNDCEEGEICTADGRCIDDPCDPDPCRHNNLILSLNMTEGSGDIAADSSGNGYDAVIAGASWTTEGKYGYGLEFDGNENTVEWSYTSPFNSFTMEAWFRTEEEIVLKTETTSGESGKTGQRYLFWPQDRGSVNGGAGISVGTNGIMVFEQGSGYMPALAVYGGNIGTSWNHIAVVYINKQPRIYLNGALVRTGIKSSRTTVYAPKIAGGGIYGWFKGVAGHIKVYNKALTGDEIFQSYSRTGYCSAGLKEGDYDCGCNYGWPWNSSDKVCVPRIYKCAAIPSPPGTEWNTVSEYFQKKDPETGKWVPGDSITQYNEEPGDSSCRYRCLHGYRWSGTKCEPKPECSTGDNLGAGVTALDLLKAMDICDFYNASVPGSWGIVPGSAVIGKANYPSDPRSVNEKQYGVKTIFGEDVSNLPIFGDNMTILSSGRARDANDIDPTEGNSYEYEMGNPPVDFVFPHGGSLPVTKEGCVSGNGANDSVLLQVKLKVPSFARSFSFDFRFFSQEYWEYTCTAYNDFFITMLDSSWTPEDGGTPIPEDKNISFDSAGNYISVNSDQFFTVCNPKTCVNSGAVYTCPDGIAALNGTGYPATNAGATRWLTTTAPVVPGEIITLRFIIWDTTDRNVDSLVLLDNFRWHALPGSGPATYACWDTNQNGICDMWEDINGDGVCTERDC
jgi:hypothetical protein